MANLRTALGKAISKIRFCTLSVPQFATICRTYPGLLSEDESADVHNAITLKEPGVSTDVLQKSSWECSFSKGERFRIGTPIDYDYILFAYSKKINLNGLILCSRIDAEIRVEVDIREGEVKRPTYTALILENGTKFIFDNPIQLESFHPTTIRIFSEAFQQPITSFLHGFKLQNKVVKNGVEFRFLEPICTKLNLITTFIFELM